MCSLVWVVHQKGAYGQTATTYRYSSARSLSCSDDDSNNLAICQIDGTTARAWPSGFIYDQPAKSTRGIHEIPSYDATRRQGDKISQRKSRKGYRCTVFLHRCVYDCRRRSVRSVFRVGKTILRSALSQIEYFINNALVRQKTKPANSDVVSSSPFPALKVNGRLRTLCQWLIRSKSSHYMRWSYECSIFRNEERGPFNYFETNCPISIGCETDDRGDGMFYLRNGLYESSFAGIRLVKSYRSAAAARNDNRKEQNPDKLDETMATSGTLIYKGPAFVGKCRIMEKPDVLFFKCDNLVIPARKTPR